MVWYDANTTSNSDVKLRVAGNTTSFIMYEDYFNLREKPFSTSPDTRFLFLTSQHNEALTKAKYAIEEKMGLSTIHGDVGTGKTTLSRHLVSKFSYDPQYNLAILVHPDYPSPFQLLREIRREFGSTKPRRSFTDEINEFKSFLWNEHQQGKTNVLIIDEAQRLKPTLFEVIRHLHNFVPENERLLQVVLFGQNELVLKIDKMPDFKDRVTIFGALSSLTKEDMKDIIEFRWNVAGGKQQPFTDKALDAIFRFSGGSPRKLCKLCDNALIRAFSAEKSHVDADMITEAATDIRLNEVEGVTQRVEESTEVKEPV